MQGEIALPALTATSIDDAPSGFGEIAHMFFLIASAALAGSDAGSFPERTPGMIEECLENAVEHRLVSTTKDSHKYICGGPSAEQLWTYLEDAKIESYEQDVGKEGYWLSRDFPLGACFKRSRLADGTPATAGLSCTIWIPRVGVK